MTNENKLEKIKKLADAMYYAAGNLGPNVGSGERLRKTMEEYHQFVIHEYHKKEPVSEDFKQFEEAYLEKEKDEILCVYDRHAGLVDGANWQKEQFEKNRLKHCDSITNEQAELEQGFIDQHLDKYNRMPTFLDAIEYGMRLHKEQTMKEAIEAEYWDCSFMLDGGMRDKFEDGQKVRIIVIKEE